MKVLTTVQGSYITGTAIADAVVRCNESVTVTRQIDCVSVPFVNDDGGLDWVQILVGPPYEIAVDPIETTLPELVHPDAVARVERRRLDVDPFPSTPFSWDDVEWAEGVDARSG